MVDISEKNLETTIESLLLAGGPDHPMDAKSLREQATVPGIFTPGGYYKRSAADYDRALCLIPEDALTLVKSTQPKEWSKLVKQYGTETEARFLSRLAKEIERRGALDALVCATIAFLYHHQPAQLMKLQNTSEGTQGYGPFYVINPEQNKKSSV